MEGLNLPMSIFLLGVADAPRKIRGQYYIKIEKKVMQLPLSLLTHKQQNATVLLRKNGCGMYWYVTNYILRPYKPLPADKIKHSSANF